VTQVARVLYLVLLGIWAGAGLYHLLVIMPAALSAFSSKQEALGFLGRTLGDLDTYGLVAGPLIIVALYAGWGGARRRLGLRAILGLFATIGALISGHWLGPKIAGLEAALATGAAVTQDLNRLYLIGDGLSIAIVVTALVLLIATPSSEVSRSGSRIELGGMRS